VGEYQVPAVVGAIKVLSELGRPGEAGATQAELASTTGLSKSTLHNLLSTLEAHEFVRRDPDSRRYRLGPALIPLGNAATRQVKLIRAAVDRLAPMAEQHRLSFAIAQRTGEDEVRIIERFYPVGDVHVGITVGSSYGPLDGALGKVLLAAMDPKRAEKLIKNRRLPAHTEATKTSPADLLRDIEEVRKRGWATSKGEFNENYAVATGVRVRSGELGLMVLALGFANQFDDRRIEEVGSLLCDTADAVMADAGVEAVTVADVERAA
jgi:IclR family acetate operon transcriptional repressor